MSRIGTNFVKQRVLAMLAASLITAAACGPAAHAQSGAAANDSQDPAALVGPIALYPDDLIAIILPASTYPVQIVEAARFLDRHEKNPSLQPDPSWDDTVVALLNYPEALRMMSENLNWTTSLGQAVLDSQAGVMDAIQAFRRRAYAAGNLRSDSHQKVTRNADGTIEIQPADPEVVYIPYYVPQRAVVYETAPAVHFYDHPFPLYYYPYPAGYSFSVNFFWGVTSAFSISWRTHALDYCAPNYRGHPYYGRHYYAPYYVRRDRDDLRRGDRDDLRRRDREHVWHSDRHRAAGPERRASFTARDRRRSSDIGTRRDGADFRARRNFDATAGFHQTPTRNALHRARAQSIRRPRAQDLRRPRTFAFAARDAHDTFARPRAGRTEQPPHRPSTRRPIRRAPAQMRRAAAARSAPRPAPRIERRRSGAAHPIVHRAEGRAAQRHGERGGRRSQRR